MAFRIQLRRDLSNKWSVNNPILLEGEIGYETDTSYIKIGDSVTPWNELPYWQGGTGGTSGVALRVLKEGNIVEDTTYNLNFSGDFNVTAPGGNTAYVSLSGAGPSGSTSYAPYFSVTVLLTGGNFSSFISSRGPGGAGLTGSPWNFILSNNGNNITVTHNTGSRPMALATYATNSGNVFIKNPNGTSTAAFSLVSDSDYNSFTVYGVNKANTGADYSGTVDISWMFGSTSN